MDDLRAAQMAADLMGWSSIGEIAAAENYQDADGYTLALASAMQDGTVPLDTQRERLQALAKVGAGLAGSKCIAQELVRHHVLLSALFQRLVQTAGELAQENRGTSSAAVERYVTAAVKVNKTALATLSALMVVKGQATPTAHASEPTDGSDAAAAATGVGEVVEQASGTMRQGLGVVQIA